jgi:hypothetical protein
MAADTEYAEFKVGDLVYALDHHFPDRLGRIIKIKGKWATIRYPIDQVGSFVQFEFKVKCLRHK